MHSSKPLWLALALSILSTSVGDAQLAQTGAGSSGAGAVAPSFLLQNVGSAILVDVGSKLRVQ
jgi:hypothetical protein